MQHNTCSACRAFAHGPSLFLQDDSSVWDGCTSGVLMHPQPASQQEHRDRGTVHALVLARSPALCHLRGLCLWPARPAGLHVVGQRCVTLLHTRAGSAGGSERAALHCCTPTPAPKAAPSALHCAAGFTSRRCRQLSASCARRPSWRAAPGAQHLRRAPARWAGPAALAQGPAQGVRVWHQSHQARAAPAELRGRPELLEHLQRLVRLLLECQTSSPADACLLRRSILGGPDTPWQPWESKFELLIEPLQSLRNEEIILVVDGQDVLCFPCARSLVDSFRVYNVSVLLQAARFQEPHHRLMARPALLLLCLRLRADPTLSWWLAAATVPSAAQAYHSQALPHGASGAHSLGRALHQRRCSDGLRRRPSALHHGVRALLVLFISARQQPHLCCCRYYFRQGQVSLSSYSDSRWDDQRCSPCLFSACLCSARAPLLMPLSFTCLRRASCSLSADAACRAGFGQT